MPRILIVDDESAVLSFVGAVFRRAGFDVVAAADPEAALAACQSHTIDVLLTDVRMPGMTGHELARWVAVNFPSTKTVLMSGYDLACEQCPYSPRCALIAKPFRAEELLAAVRDALAG
jgi:two-component system, cell cycle response regulator CpdR